MNLGAFSISLSVRDLGVSRDFYGRLGFEPVGGNHDEGWLILRNGDHVIGLFEGKFEQNILTFNPGWDQQGRESNPFTDVREIQKELRERNVKLAREADENTTGPASCVVVDPDGNPILIDQHR
ncbi:MAG: VOC family protein [Gammaproteobacteria bacterium]|jgi:catechol 2,3-dioxygenase-like lactoylglutathione lyase family enzyme